LADSFAWAIINANSDVVEESVYWPDVAQSTVSDAPKLQALVVDPSKSKAYMAGLPKAFGHGQVVIHHTPCVGGPPEAKATYDVLDRGDIGMAMQRHFEIAGQEVVLAPESAPIPPNSSKGP
jgi:hypothetical protein